jgi:hypothetical protein
MLEERAKRDPHYARITAPVEHPLAGMKFRVLLLVSR